MARRSHTNKKYSVKFKIEAVQAYLRGEGSLRDICKKYNILSPERLRQWILWYNGHREFKAHSEYAVRKDMEMREA